MIYRYFISVGMLLWFAALPLEAGWFGADFSADTLLSGPQQQQQLGRMYVSAGRVRTEMQNGNEKLVEIIDPTQGVAWLINPTQKSYMQRPVPKVLGEASDNNPCAPLSGVHCQRMGEETLDGRAAVKWRMDAAGRSRLQWQDAAHGFALRIVEGEHERMAMHFIGNEQIEGRQVEKWRSSVQGPQGMVQSEQWYDPQLNIAIRQHAPDGSLRELHNIVVGPQPDELFRLPQGYRLRQSVQQQ